MYHRSHGSHNSHYSLYGHRTQVDTIKEMKDCQNEGPGCDGSWAGKVPDLVLSKRAAAALHCPTQLISLGLQLACCQGPELHDRVTDQQYILIQIPESSKCPFLVTSNHNC